MLDRFISLDNLFKKKSLITGWDKSKGLAEEIEYAKQNGIEIEYLAHIEERSDV